MHAPRFVALSVVTASLLLASGCATPSVWEREFHRGESTATPLAPAAPVKIREVPWERVQQTLTEINEKLAKSDTHYDDWSESDKNKLKAQLLRGLQVSHSPQNVDLIGRSEFKTTDRVRPDDGTLDAFARKVGANTVIVTSAYIGKTDSVRQEAITEYRTGDGTRRRSDDRHGASSETSTMWVPIILQADENAYIAFFLNEH